MASKKSEKKSVWNLILTFGIIGIVLAVYLLLQYYRPLASGICNLSGRFNCSAISTTELGYLFDVPIPVIGLIGYVLILFSVLIRSKKLAFFMSGFGFFFCLRVTILELFFVKIICPVCIACQIDMAILFALSSLLMFRKTLQK